MSKSKSRKAATKQSSKSSELPQRRPAVADRTPTEGAGESTNRTEVAIAQYEETRFSGPIPDPYTLASYEQICPGAADRIIRMAEGQAEHRQAIEKTVITANAKNQTTGVWFAGLLSLGVVGLAALLIWKDMELWGLAAVIFQTASLCGVFVYGKISQRKELREKRETANALAKQRAGGDGS